MTRLLRMLIASCLLLLPTAAQAGLVLTFQTPQAYAGTGGGFTIDVDMHSGSVGGNAITGLLVSYLINGPGRFYTTDGASTPDELQLASSNYVFAGIGTALPGIRGTVAQTNLPLDTYTQSDTLSHTSTPFVVGSSDYLLATLHILSTDIRAVTIGIDSTNAKDPNFSFFNGAGLSTGNNVSFIVLTPGSGNNMPIPEPSSMLVWGLGALGIVATRWRGRKASA